MRDPNFIGKFFSAYDSVIKNIFPQLGANEKLLLVTLINGSWLKGQEYVWASLSELRQSSGLAENTIKKILKGLIQKNLIKVSAKETNKSSRSYTIFWPETRVTEIPNSAWALPQASGSYSSNPNNYIYPRLDADDREAFNVILKNLMPNEVLQCEEQARQFFKDTGMKPSDEEIIWCRNDLIFKTYAGPLRVEKYSE